MQPTQSTNATKRMKRSKLITSVILAGGLFATACGGGAATDEQTIADIPEAGTESSVDETNSSNEGRTELSDEDSEAAYLRYKQCLADEGVDDPFGDSEDGDSALVEFDQGEYEAFEAAQKKCEPILEDAFGSFDLSPEQQAAQADAELAFNTCMTDKGFDLGGDGGQAGFEIGADVDIADLEEAAAECDEAFNEVFSESDEQ